jgi:DNA-binding protein HU-beta
MITKTKQELIDAVRQQAHITQAQAVRAVNAITQNLIDTVTGMGRFALAGVGVFSMVTRAARTGRNPLNGTPIQIPAKQSVKFKMAVELKKRVNV